MNQLIVTGDGSHTIFVPGMNEHYHSIHGAVQESQHIFIKNGFETVQSGYVNIFEAGFGTGLNALLTAVRNIECGKKVNYVTVEKYPLPVEIISFLNYWQFAGKEGEKIFRLLHSAPWDEEFYINENFRIKKIRDDLTVMALRGNYDLIYFDAFGPDKQPDMWSDDVFSKISSVTEKEGIFVTYSAKGEIKRRLKANGFEVSLLPGPPGKRQMIRAVKI